MQHSRQKSFTDLLLMASLVFGMFFGAGNLIFPVQLGQMAGSHWVLATAGFLITGTVVPYLAMLAVSTTHSQSVYDLAKPVAPWFGMALLVLIHMTIGPFFGTPRTAATGFTMGIAPFLPEQWQTLGMVIFSALFFGLAFFLSITDSRVTSWIGRYLTPILVVLLAFILIVAAFNPMGDLNQPTATAYKTNTFMQGFLDGYNTMDGIALVALAVSVVYAVRGLGYRGAAVSKTLAKAGLLSIIFEAIIYTALIALGVSSLAIMKPAENGGISLMAIINHYFGTFGSILTGVLVILAVFTTAVGLFSSFAHDMHLIFPKFSYNVWLSVSAIGSFATANAGLTNIISWSAPVLMFIYPFVLALIVLSLTKKYFNGAQIVYQLTMLFVTPSACFDALAASPLAKNALVLPVITFYHQYVPFASQGLGWVLPGLVGALLGLSVYAVKRQNAK